MAWAQWMIAAPLAVGEFFFPRICHGCLERITENEDTICDHCRSRLQAPPAPVCPSCGAGKAQFLDHGQCKRCPRPMYLDAARASARINDMSRSLIHDLKYYGHYELAPVMGRRLYVTLEGEWAFEAPEVIVPVPLHEERQFERGFNQAQLIAHEFSRLSGIELGEEALQRERPTQTQALLTSAGARKKNVAGAFGCPSPALVAGRTVLLIDDVMTTGATINECARVLKDNEAERVVALVFARA